MENKMRTHKYNSTSYDELQADEEDELLKQILLDNMVYELLSDDNAEWYQL